MFGSRRAIRAVALPALLVLALLLAGCGGDWEQVLRPPRANVAGVQTVAIFPFASWASDPGLARSLTDRVYRAVQEANWYDVIPPEQVESLLVQRRIDPHNVTGGAVAREVAAALGADAYIVGVADFYFEDVSYGQPYVWEDRQPHVGVRWRVRQDTTVTVGMQAQMVNVHTGATIHRWQGTRDGVMSDIRDINWMSADPPPNYALPMVHRRQVPEARNRAIANAVSAFAANILPYYEWVRRESDQ